eukprot:12802340-Heterocapsa_arctica.AAC.1
MGTPPTGTQVPPFESQMFEHWHAWETQPECGPTEGEQQAPETPTWEGTWVPEQHNLVDEGTLEP